MQYGMALLCGAGGTYDSTTLPMPAAHQTVCLVASTQYRRFSHTKSFKLCADRNVCCVLCVCGFEYKRQTLDTSVALPTIFPSFSCSRVLVLSVPCGSFSSTMVPISLFWENDTQATTFSDSVLHFFYLLSLFCSTCNTITRKHDFRDSKSEIISRAVCVCALVLGRNGTGNTHIGTGECT